jgi:hypothetical protein
MSDTFHVDVDRTRFSLVTACPTNKEGVLHSITTNGDSLAYSVSTTIAKHCKAPGTHSSKYAKEETLCRCPAKGLRCAAAAKMVQAPVNLLAICSNRLISALAWSKSRPQASTSLIANSVLSAAAPGIWAGSREIILPCCGFSAAFLAFESSLLVVERTEGVILMPAASRQGSTRDGLAY